jgi:hypothetical protein
MASAVNSGRTFRAEDLTIVDHFRFEGVSDPDDSSIVYAIESDGGLYDSDLFAHMAEKTCGGP